MTSPMGATAASDWKSKRSLGVLLTLPSGQKARVRRTLSIMSLMKSGDLPNPLAEHVTKAMRAAGDERSIAEALEQGEMPDIEVPPDDIEAYSALVIMIEEEIPNIFVYPKVYPVPEGENAGLWQPDDPDGISLADVDWGDRMFAFSFAQGGPAELVRFPEPSKDVVAGRDGGAVSDPAKQSDGTG